MYTSNSQKLLAASLLLLVTCSLLCDHVTGSDAPQEKRSAIRRYPRTKFRVGYLFGKRSSGSPTNSALFDIVSRRSISKKELEALMLRNLQILSEVVTILDKNDDGYISAADLV